MERDDGRLFEDDELFDDSTFDNNQKDNQNFEQFFSPLIPDSEQLRRAAFYTVVNNPQTPEENYKGLLDTHLKYYEDIKSKLEKYHQEYVILYKTELESVEDKIKKNKLDLETHLSELGEKKEEKEKLIQKINELKDELKKSFIDLGRQKKELVQNRIDELKSEVGKHLDNINEIVDKKIELSEKLFNQRDKVPEKRALRFQNLLKSFEDELEKIKNKLPFGEGISLTVYSHLLSVGLILAGVAGWFFATYVQIVQLGKSDFLSLILEKLVLGGRILFPENIFLAIIFNFSTYLLISLVLVLFVWLGQRGVNKLEDKGLITSKKGRRDREEIENMLSLEMGDGSNTFKTKLGSDNVFSFFLQLIPIILILGILLTIVSISVNPTDIKDVQNVTLALSGQIIGSSLAIGLSGVFLIYIIFIIEPRKKNLNENRAIRDIDVRKNLQKNNQGKSSENNSETSNSDKSEKKSNSKIDGKNEFGEHFKNNWELALSFLLFLFSLFIIASGYADNRSIASIAFAMVVIFSGLVIAYGTRYKGLVLSYFEIERKHKELSYAIWENEGPRPIGFLQQDLQLFKTKFEDLSSQMYELIEARNKLASRSMGLNTNGKNRHINSLPLQKKPGFVTRIRKVFISSDNNEPNQEVIINSSEKQIPILGFLPEEDQNYFPDNFIELQFIITEYREKVEEFENVNLHIQGLKNMDTPFIQRVQQNLDDLEQKRAKLYHDREEHKKIFLKECERLKEIEDKLILSFSDGYNLGMLYLQEEKEPKSKLENNGDKGANENNEID